MMKKLTAILLVLVLALSSLTGCKSSTDTAQESTGSGDKELVPMTIAFCTWAGYAPVFIAKELGCFEEAGYDVTVEIMEDESTYGAAFVSNSIQALGQVLDRDIIQYAAGAPEQYVCTMDCSTGGDGLIATADIQTMDDLAGKKVALDKSATSYFFFLQALADSNITEDQIEIVEMGNDAAGEAFLAGNVDAAVTWEPALSNCSEREGGHVLVSSADYPKAIIDVLTVNSNFAKDHPDVYEKLADCWNKAVAYLNENFDEGCEIMAEGLDLEVDEVKAECEGITFYGEEENAEFNNPDTEENVVDIANLAASFWVEKELMDTNDLTGFFPTIEE
ncbi:MAG: ABC transporter substrate-binding protein [Lachnospiraceae bacterium]|nr:ABC transporter substrate-binding protein [Lachnospiraceae bacterium]